MNQSCKKSTKYDHAEGKKSTLVAAKLSCHCEETLGIAFFPFYINVLALPQLSPALTKHFTRKQSYENYVCYLNIKIKMLLRFSNHKVSCI